MVNNQQAIMNQQQFYQHMNEQDMAAYQRSYNMMCQTYLQSMNRPIIPKIELENLSPEYIYHILTPQAIDQVNRATALIEEEENQDNEPNSINDEMEKDSP